MLMLRGEGWRSVGILCDEAPSSVVCCDGGVEQGNESEMKEEDLLISAKANSWLTAMYRSGRLKMSSWLGTRGLSR